VPYIIPVFLNAEIRRSAIIFAPINPTITTATAAKILGKFSIIRLIHAVRIGRPIDSVATVKEKNKTIQNSALLVKVEISSIFSVVTYFENLGFVVKDFARLKKPFTSFLIILAIK
jgi:hypothetical protein